MPEDETLERAREDEREGKSPSTQAGEFVREEMEHIREGEHGASSAKQAIAIGFSHSLLLARSSALFEPSFFEIHQMGNTRDIVAIGATLLFL